MIIILKSSRQIIVFKLCHGQKQNIQLYTNNLFDTINDKKV